MFILFPGRHHLLTDFQFKYLYRIIQTGLMEEPDVNGNPIGLKTKIYAVIFAVTSCNHKNTRRNPLPFHLRAMSLQEFSNGLNVPAYVYGIDDVGFLDDFASYTLKQVKHESDGAFDLTPENCIVLCSTPVLEMYEKLGFKILPAELINKKRYKYKTELPWELVSQIADQKTDWIKNINIIEKIHPASLKIWMHYNYSNKIEILFNDKIVGDDGDITITRDYNTYIAQMDQNAQLKYKDTRPFILPGRIGDIGCAVGSWIKLVSSDEKFRESDFYGIEAARQLFDLCIQRKHNKDFTNPNIFFSQKNAITGLVFEKESMNTIHSSSLTHEIESYGGREDLLKFIKNRYKELIPGGVWINRDVVGPENSDQTIYMELNETDGRNNDFDKEIDSTQVLDNYLQDLSTFSRFLRFTTDFRKEEGYTIKYEIQNINKKKLIILSLKDAAEFIYRKDYTDNWKSEMHETFCFWSFNDWKKNISNAGFIIDDYSKVFCNKWIIENRCCNKVKLYKMEQENLIETEYPVTTMILVCKKVK